MFSSFFSQGQKRFKTQLSNEKMQNTFSIISNISKIRNFKNQKFQIFNVSKIFIFLPAFGGPIFLVYIYIYVFIYLFVYVFFACCGPHILTQFHYLVIHKFPFLFVNIYSVVLSFVYHFFNFFHIFACCGPHILTQLHVVGHPF